MSVDSKGARTLSRGDGRFIGGRGLRVGGGNSLFISWQLLLATVGAALGRGGGHRVRYWSAALGNGVIVVLGALIALSAFAA